MLSADCRVKIEMDDYGEGACGEASESLVRGRTQREPAAVEKEDFSRIVRNADCPWPPQNGDRHGGTFLTSSPVSIKTPRYTGKADWEAFHTQFELLADASGWSVKVKALQLAMCLADDALSCLLLLSPEDRGDYVALVGALRRRFGLCVKPGLMRSELCNRRRKPGETLRALANDIESLSRRYREPHAASRAERTHSGSVSPGPFPYRTTHADPASPPADFARGLGDGHREGAGVGWSNRRSSCSSADGEIGEGEE